MIVEFLIVERFDRRWTDVSWLLRLPQEDCCQALSVPPTLKYQSDGGPGVESILNLLKGSDDAIGDQRLFLKAIVVFWLIGADRWACEEFQHFLAAQQSVSDDAAARRLFGTTERYRSTDFSQQIQAGHVGP